jgi:FkbM family methyltransferase
MNPFSIARDTYTLLTRHPLNRGRRLAAAQRYLRWQIGSLVAPGQIAVDFVDDTLLLGSFGMSSTTCNVFAGLYEFEDMAFVLHMLRPDDLFVDVGANVGVYTVLAAGAARASAVSFEPVATTFEQLSKNLRLNGLTERVTAIQAAVGAKDGTIELTEGRGAMNRVAVSDQEKKSTVSLRRLDSVLGDRSAALLKIDVEGFETEVIRGAQSLLKNADLKALIVELNGSGRRYGFDDATLSREICAFGFQVCRYDPFQRSLRIQSSGEPGPSGNALFVRDPAAVEQLTGSARAFRVHGHNL